MCYFTSDGLTASAVVCWLVSLISWFVFYSTRDLNALDPHVAATAGRLARILAKLVLIFHTFTFFLKGKIRK